MVPQTYLSSNCGGAHPTSPLSARAAYPVHARQHCRDQRAECSVKIGKRKMRRAFETRKSARDLPPPGVLYMCAYIHARASVFHLALVR